MHEFQDENGDPRSHGHRPMAAIEATIDEDQTSRDDAMIADLNDFLDDSVWSQSGF